MEIEEFKERKKEMERNIASAIAHEMNAFRNAITVSIVDASQIGGGREFVLHWVGAEVDIT